MRVFKLRKTLALRLPAAVVESPKLKAGDELEIRIAGDHAFEVRRENSRQEALARLRRLRRPVLDL